MWTIKHGADRQERCGSSNCYGKILLLLLKKKQWHITVPAIPFKQAWWKLSVEVMVLAGKNMGTNNNTVDGNTLTEGHAVYENSAGLLEQVQSQCSLEKNFSHSS